MAMRHVTMGLYKVFPFEVELAELEGRALT